MVYADYSYYVGVYYGNAVPENDFKRMSKRASAYLDCVTFGRIQDVTDKIKDACCALCDAYYRDEQDGGTLASETKGEWSVTYAEASRESLQDKACRIVRQYLGGTGLLFRGVYDGA